MPVVLRTGKAVEDIDLVVPQVDVRALAVLEEVLFGRVATGRGGVTDQRAGGVSVGMGLGQGCREPRQ